MKLLLVVIALTTATDLFSQTLGVRAGLNLSNMLMKDDEDTYSDDFKMVPGFHVGATAEFPISDLLSFETGLILSTKGFKVEESGAEIKANLFYLDIPLTIKATHDLGGAKIFGALGPYLGMGLSGKYKYEYTSGGTTESDDESVEWGSDEEDDDLKRFDFGLVVGAGVEINVIQIGVFYNLGIANISSYNDDGTKAANRVLGISLGYRFGGK